MTAGTLSAGAVRRARLAEARVYLVCDAREQQGDLEAFLDAVLGAGVDIVQLREKEAEAGDLLRWARVFKAAADRYGALFVVNDRPDVAVAAEADGVHLGQNDMPAAVARRIVGPHLLIGLSTHAEREFDGADTEADYLCVGPVRETPTKPGRVATGFDFVSFAARRAAENPRPWFAIGGLDAAVLPSVVAAGATRVAIVRAVTEAREPAEAVRQLLEALLPTS